MKNALQVLKQYFLQMDQVGPQQGCATPQPPPHSSGPGYRSQSRSSKYAFMNDNAPSHAANATTQFLTKKVISVSKLMQWPPASPDRNPREPLCDCQKRSMMVVGNTMSGMQVTSSSPCRMNFTKDFPSAILILSNMAKLSLSYKSPGNRCIAHTANQKFGMPFSNLVKG